MKIHPKIPWITVALLSLPLCLATPVLPQTLVEVVCGDGTRHPPGFDCRAYLCSTGWVQAHGQASVCSSPGSSRPIYRPPVYTPPPPNNPALEAQLSGLTNQKESLQAQVNGLQQTHSQLETQAQNFSNEVAALQNEIAGIKGSNARNSRRIFDLAKQEALTHLKGLDGASPSASAAENSFGLKPFAGPVISPKRPNDAAGKMAAICNKRALLTRQQSELAQEVPAEELSIRDLQYQFQKNAANAQWWGNFSSGAKQVKERLEVLEKVEGRIAKTSGKIPEEELTEYEIIEKGTVAWVADFTKLYAGHEITNLNKDTVTQLGNLSASTRRFAYNLGRLRQVNHALAILPACNSTELVK